MEVSLSVCSIEENEQRQWNALGCPLGAKKRKTYVFLFLSFFYSKSVHPLHSKVKMHRLLHLYPRKDVEKLSSILFAVHSAFCDHS